MMQVADTVSGAQGGLKKGHAWQGLRKGLLSKGATLALLGLGGCFSAPPPPAPPLPGNGTASTMTLTVPDVLTLQALDQRALWLNGIAGLASSHSNRPVVQSLGTEAAKAYQTLQEKTVALAKSTHLSLASTLTKEQQARLDEAKRLFGPGYDRLLENTLTQPIPPTLKTSLETASKTGPLKGVAEAMLQAQTTYALTARSIRAAAQEACTGR